MSVGLFVGKLSYDKKCYQVSCRIEYKGYLPEFVTITEGKVGDVEIGRTPQFPKVNNDCIGITK